MCTAFILHSPSRMAVSGQLGSTVLGTGSAIEKDETGLPVSRGCQSPEASGLQGLPVSLCRNETGNHSERLCGLRLSEKDFWRRQEFSWALKQREQVDNGFLFPLLCIYYSLYLELTRHLIFSENTSFPWRIPKSKVRASSHQPHLSAHLFPSCSLKSFSLCKFCQLRGEHFDRELGWTQDFQTWGQGEIVPRWKCRPHASCNKIPSAKGYGVENTCYV